MWLYCIYTYMHTQLLSRLFYILFICIKYLYKAFKGVATNDIWTNQNYVHPIKLSWHEFTVNSWEQKYVLYNVQLLELSKIQQTSVAKINVIQTLYICCANIRISDKFSIKKSREHWNVCFTPWVGSYKKLKSPATKRISYMPIWVWFSLSHRGLILKIYFTVPKTTQNNHILLIY